MTSSLSRTSGKTGFVPKEVFWASSPPSLESRNSVLRGTLYVLALLKLGTSRNYNAATSGSVSADENVYVSAKNSNEPRALNGPIISQLTPLALKIFKISYYPDYSIFTELPPRLNTLWCSCAPNLRCMN